MAKESNYKKTVALSLGISPKHLNRVSKQQVKDEALRGEINSLHQKHPSYGHRRVGWALAVNHKRVSRVMRRFGIKPPRRRVNHFCTRSTNHHTYTNLTKGIVLTRQHQLWCADVSFIEFNGKFWYLATIEDVYTRRVLAAQVGKYHNHQLILTTVKQAIKNTGTVPEIFHTDQGTEFMAKAVTDYLEQYGIKVSVSDKASPWQNGYKESFFGRFKDEFGDFNRFETVSELIEEIYSQIRYYNQERIHTALRMPPAAYAQQPSDNSLHKWGT